MNTDEVREQLVFDLLNKPLSELKADPKVIDRLLKAANESRVAVSGYSHQKRAMLLQRARELMKQVGYEDTDDKRRLPERRVRKGQRKVRSLR
jgi:hypothetical protein